MVVRLSKVYPSRRGAPRIEGVEEAIFRHTYFADCRACYFCLDQCCTWGVDVDADNMARLIEFAEPLEARTGIPRERWFEAGLRADPEFPGGRAGRIRAEAGGCVFLDRRNRGCHIHSFCLEEGLDVYGLKPLVSSLFPLTFEDGILVPSDEVERRTLACLGAGASLYRGSRGALEHHFGSGFVAELDCIESAIITDSQG